MRLPGATAPVRVLTTPVMEGGRLVQLVQVAMSLEVVEAARARFLLVLAGLLPVALGAAAAGGWFLAGRALRPVDDMVETARRIGGADLARRITAENADDELGRLAAVLNDMLGRLERSFDAARQFSADAAHELRTPLTILKGELEVALGTTAADAPYRRALESCLEEVDRLASLVEDLLFLARSDAGALAPAHERVDLASVVSDAAPALEALASRAGVAFRVEPSSAVARPGQRPPALPCGLQPGRERREARRRRRPRDGRDAARRRPRAARGARRRTGHQQRRTGSASSTASTAPIPPASAAAPGSACPSRAPSSSSTAGRSASTSAPGAGASFRVSLPLAPR